MLRRNVVARCRDNKYREDPGDEVGLSRHKMEWIGDEKICEVRGEVCVDTPNDVGNGYEPGAIAFWKSGLGTYFIRVRKTKGAATEVCQSINDFFICMIMPSVIILLPPL